MNAERKYLTIRNVSPVLAQALEAERLRRGSSLNQTVLDLLTDSLGLSGGRTKSNGLRALAGGWSADDEQEFLAATEWTRRVDSELWT